MTATAHQLHRALGVVYKTGWLLSHRIQARHEGRLPALLREAPAPLSFRIRFRYSDRVALGVTDGERADLVAGKRLTYRQPNEACFERLRRRILRQREKQSKPKPKFVILASSVGATGVVSVKDEQPKIVRVNVTLPGDVLEQIDNFAESHGYTRSGFLTQAAKKLMETA